MLFIIPIVIFDGSGVIMQKEVNVVLTPEFDGKDTITPHNNRQWHE